MNNLPLEKIYDLLENQKVDEAVDVLFDWSDTAMQEGRIQDVDQIFLTVNFNKLDTNLIVAMACLAYAYQLPSYALFYQKVKARLLVLASDRIEGLLMGLSPETIE
jgi:hypothetical protein